LLRYGGPADRPIIRAMSNVFSVGGLGRSAKDLLNPLPLRGKRLGVMAAASLPRGGTASIDSLWDGK
jgi:hypothetical protein